MPKPVLSDSLFNADDVATAVLSEANLQITNSDLGVTDRSSIFTLQSGWGSQYFNAFSFNGFMFLSGRWDHSDGTPSTGESIVQISNSDFYPSTTFVTPALGFQNDLAQFIIFATNGTVQVHNPINYSAPQYYLSFNCHYRF